MSGVRLCRNLCLLVLAMLAGCVAVPEGIEPVTGFEPERYLGRWYEIARLPHSFEAGMSDVSATYTPLDDGCIRVLNRGYRVAEAEWNEAEGRACFVEGRDTGYLKVSFFGPFYGAYVVFELDEDYQYSLVSGPDWDYFWILSRTPYMDEALLKKLVARAGELGFDTDQLIYVSHQ